MCVYCNMGDHTFRYDPPWKRDTTSPYFPQLPQSVPQPVYPLPPMWQPWPLERLKEYHDLLKAVKDMEDKLGCPCEPNKADYLKLIKERIDHLEAKEAAAKREGA